MPNPDPHKLLSDPAVSFWLSNVQPNELRALRESGLPLTGEHTDAYTDPTELTSEQLLQESLVPLVQVESDDVIRSMREAQEQRVMATRRLSEAVGVPLLYSPDLRDTLDAAISLGYETPPEDTDEMIPVPRGKLQAMREAGLPFRHQEISQDGRVVYSDTGEPVEEAETEPQVGDEEDEDQEDEDQRDFIRRRNQAEEASAQPLRASGVPGETDNPLRDSGLPLK